VDDRRAGSGRVRGGARDVLGRRERRGDEGKEDELHRCDVTVVIEEDEVGSERVWCDCVECGVCGSDRLSEMREAEEEGGGSNL
jgi:hypothetical protein